MTNYDKDKVALWAELVLALYKKGLEYPAWSHDRAIWHHKSLLMFVERFIRPPLPIPDFHKKVPDGWYWLLVAEPTYINLTARGHGKSSVHSIFYPTWRICCDRNSRFIILSSVAEQAQSFLSAIKAHLEFNPYIVEGFSHRDAFREGYEGFKLPQDRGWGTDHITVRRRPTDHTGRILIEKDKTVLTLGVGSSNVGPHAEYVIYDDVCNPDNCATRYRANKTLRWIEDSFSMVEPQGQKIIVGTRKALFDPYSELVKREDFKVFESPAILNFEKKIVLWPERWSWERLMKMRRDQGFVQFNLNYLLRPMSEEESHFPMDFIKRQFRETMVLPIEHHTSELVKVTVVDPALALKGKGKSYFAAVTLGVDRDGKIYWLDIYRKQGARFLEQWEKIVDIWRRYDSEIVIEQNALQGYFIESLPKESGMIIVPHWTGQDVNRSFETGIPALSTLTEQQRNVIPRGDDRSRKLTDLLIYEMHMWPRGETDDVLMAYWLAVTRLRQILKNRFFNFTLQEIEVRGPRDIGFGAFMLNKRRLERSEMNWGLPMSIRSSTNRAKELKWA